MKAEIELDTLKAIKKRFRKIWLYEIFDIYIKHLQHTNYGKGKKNQFYFKVATNEDIQMVANQFGKHYGNDPAKELLNRFNSGDVLLLGLTESYPPIICFLSWLSEKEPLFLEAKRKKMLKNAVYSYRTLVPSKYRQMGLGKRGIAFAEKIAGDLGYEKIVGFVREDNLASKKMLESRGWIVDGKLLRRVILGRGFLKVIQ